MKMIFKLSDAQLERAKEVMKESVIAFRSAMNHHPLETFKTISGKDVDGYTDSSGIVHHVWFGEVVGFLRINSTTPIPDLTATVHMRRLTIEGNREDITNPHVVSAVSEILGKSWRIAMPEIEGDDNELHLFWWETLDHYYQWRGDWDMYFNWLKSHLRDGDIIKQFDVHFPTQNECLALLKSGKLKEARQTYPKITEQILPYV